MKTAKGRGPAEVDTTGSASPGRDSAARHRGGDSRRTPPAALESRAGRVEIGPVDRTSYGSRACRSTLHSARELAESDTGGAGGTLAMLQRQSDMRRRRGSPRSSSPPCRQNVESLGQPIQVYRSQQLRPPHNNPGGKTAERQLCCPKDSVFAAGEKKTIGVHSDLTNRLENKVSC